MFSVYSIFEDYSHYDSDDVKTYCLCTKSSHVKTKELIKKLVKKRVFDKEDNCIWYEHHSLVRATEHNFRFEWLVQYIYAQYGLNKTDKEISSKLKKMGMKKDFLELKEAFKFVVKNFHKIKRETVYGPYSIKTIRVDEDLTFK